MGGLTLYNIHKSEYSGERREILKNDPNLEMNIDTLTDDQIWEILLEQYCSINFDDKTIHRDTRTTFINSTLKIFLDIIWEYLIYHTIDKEHKLAEICKEKILNSEVEQPSKEYISSKNIHTCLNIIQEIDKINKKFKEDESYIYNSLLQKYPDMTLENYKVTKDPFHKNISINGIEIKHNEHNKYNFYFKFSNENEKISLHLGVENHFHYSFSLSQEYTQELKQSIEDYSKVQRSKPEKSKFYNLSKELFPYYNIDNDKFNIFQFLYEEEDGVSIKGIIPSLNLRFQQQGPDKYIIEVNDIIGSFIFEGNIIGGFRSINNFDFFYILSLLNGTITWENGKKCSMNSNGTDILLNGYFQFDDYNFNGMIQNNIIQSNPYFGLTTGKMVYSTIFRKNDNKSFRLKEDFPINTKNRNFELNIPNNLLLVYNPEQVTETKEKQVRVSTSSKKSKKKKIKNKKRNRYLER